MATSGHMQRRLGPQEQLDSIGHTRAPLFVATSSHPNPTSILDTSLPTLHMDRSVSAGSTHGVSLNCLGLTRSNPTLKSSPSQASPSSADHQDLLLQQSQGKYGCSSQGSQYSKASVNNISGTSSPDSLMHQLSNIHLQKSVIAAVDQYGLHAAHSSTSTTTDHHRQGRGSVPEPSQPRYPSSNSDLSRSSTRHGGVGLSGADQHSGDAGYNIFGQGAFVDNHTQPRQLGSRSGYTHFGYNRASTCDSGFSGYSGTTGTTGYGSGIGSAGSVQSHNYMTVSPPPDLAVNRSTIGLPSSFNLELPQLGQTNGLVNTAAATYDKTGGGQIYHATSVSRGHLRATYDFNTQAQQIGHPAHVPVFSNGSSESTFNVNAVEFKHAGDVWSPSHLSKHVWLRPEEQPNWRQLLEPGVTADWNLIVNKIIEYNDQQASIYLQQKIKNSDDTIKDDIIKSIVLRALELMGNRFGNFLIQRVFECANTDQIKGLAEAIRFNTVRLSTDAFGCHVIQKAFDCVPEHFKHVMVSELLNRISDTVTHRYACHVWQKLFELRWQGAPPMIMDTVNSALTGHWTSVALGETGSLVVQNIFENCNDQDKRPCINEVLGNLDVIARGQYGNWCIQHIVEHGSADDREHAIRMVLVRAAEYSMDQYASKCIEKCLKVCGPDFLESYLQQVLARCAGDNFSPLVQIARDQYGNFLVQWILGNAGPRLREVVDAELRKHLVSLRGNKYGSKVALSCGYGPQGVRPGVPFASSHHRQHFSGPRGPLPYQIPPNHSTLFAQNRKYGHADGSSGTSYYGPRSTFNSACSPQQGSFGHYRY